MEQHKNEYYSLRRDKHREYKREYNKKQSEIKKQNLKVESDFQTTLDYLKEIDINYYEFLISHTWNFDKNEYNLFAFKELSCLEKLKVNRKLFSELEVD